MSSRLFQNILYQYKDVIDKQFGVMDESGLILACSVADKVGKKISKAPDIAKDCEEVITYEGFSFKWLGKNNDYIVFVEGEKKNSEKDCSLIAISLDNIKQYHDEKYDKTTFIKSIILDNILPGDISIKAKELRINTDMNRMVYLIHTVDNNDFNVFNIVQSLFPARNKDFVIAIDENMIVLVKEFKNNYEEEEIERISKIIVDTVNTELLAKVYVGMGTVVKNIKDLAKAFKEAQIALEVGKVFGSERYIISYNNLGIGRLIYQLPRTMCELFLTEVFEKKTIDELGNEMLFTIQKFFENNLNVSETSRQLYVHRNTLVYRLDKIQRLTGLDLRIFDHAIVFKVAMMVKKYLDSDGIS
jgi:carbohydrate diacid regulator